MDDRLWPEDKEDGRVVIYDANRRLVGHIPPNFAWGLMIRLAKRAFALLVR